MIPAIRSEFRKLFTVRSTYLIITATLLIVIFFAGYIGGYQDKPVDLLRPDLLTSQATSAVVFVGLIFAFAGLLLVGHEYRYTTIMYSLTSSNQRSKVLFAKFLTVTVFAVVFSAVIAVFSPACAVIGAHLHGLTITGQQFNLWSILGRCIFVGWAYCMFAFVLVATMRNQVGAIVTFLLLPLIGEGILSLLLKGNSKYLPFKALQSVADPTIVRGSTLTQGISTTLIYIAIGLLISYVLFTRRDAN